MKKEQETMREAEALLNQQRETSLEELEMERDENFHQKIEALKEREIEIARKEAVINAKYGQIDEGKDANQKQEEECKRLKSQILDKDQQLKDLEAKVRMLKENAVVINKGADQMRMLAMGLGAFACMVMLVFGRS